MSIHRISKILLKDLRLGPRSPIFLWALVFPIASSLIVHVAFGSLFDPKPRLGIVDLGHSEITAIIAGLEGIDLAMPNSVPELKKLIENNDLDAGLVFKKGFDAAIRSGQKPLLEFYIGGESPASNRLILVATTLDTIRQVEGKWAPATVEINVLGDKEVLSISTRLIPALVFFALLIAGMFVTAFGVVEEKEKKTLDAILATPVSLGEVLTAKAGLGFILAVLLAYATLLLNNALGAHPAALLVTLVIAGVMAVEFGLIYGTAARDIKTLFTLMKTLNVFLFAPVIFYIFPEWPQWIAKIFPTYWLIKPIFEIAIKDANLIDVWVELAISAGICILLILPVMALKHKMQATLSRN